MNQEQKLEELGNQIISFAENNEIYAQVAENALTNFLEFFKNDDTHNKFTINISDEKEPPQLNPNGIILPSQIIS